VRVGMRVCACVRACVRACVLMRPAIPRFPDFKLLSPAGRYNDLVSCIIITHFHLDHCGALPYFTEVRCATHTRNTHIVEPIT
jgi:Cft2 family RNA processing exonuclease